MRSGAGCTPTSSGGAQMLRSAAMGDRAQIGMRNVEAARAALASLGLSLRAEQTGGELGRTVWLDVGSGELKVTTAGKPAVEAAVRAGHRRRARARARARPRRAAGKDRGPWRKS